MVACIDDVIFFFKQKTAYEMRISDWSSDVCSSDLYGIFAIIAGVSSLSRRARWIELLLGVLGIVAGAVTIFNPFAGALSLVLLIGAWLLVSGIFEIVSALRIAHDRAWRLVLGVLDVVLGGLLLFSGPGTGLVFLAFCVGISFLFRGVFRSEEHTSKLPSLMRISYAVFCLKKKKTFLLLLTTSQTVNKHKNT